MTTITVSSGQVASMQTYTSGSELLVLAGGTSSQNSFGPGAEAFVSGSSVSDTFSGIGIGGTGTHTSAISALLLVVGGGVASAATVTSGASFFVTSGGSIDGLVVSGASGTNSGLLSNVTIGSGAVVSSYGMTNGADVTSGGELLLHNTGQYRVNSIAPPHASGVTVETFGILSVGAGFGTVVSGTVLNGGSAVVFGNSGYQEASGGEAVHTTILSGGVLTIGNYATASGTIIGSGGREVLAALAGAVGDVISGGTLEFGLTHYGVYAQVGTTSEYGPITFEGTGGTVRDDGPSSISGVIAGFNTTDHVVLAGLPYDANATFTVSGDIVTIVDDGDSYTLDIVGAAALPLTFGVGGGSANIQVACYCVGTAILTVKGEVAIETIVPGDMVITARGQAEPVVWVGRRSYAGRFLRNQPHLLPIRIRAGALGRGLPRRDLLVSPNHALLLDRVLVPAGALVDGHRITVERDCPQVDYVHLELARHDVILAEGAAAETFIDDSSRGLFHTTQGTPGIAAGYCAPRLANGFEIEAIRRRLAA